MNKTSKILLAVAILASTIFLAYDAHQRNLPAVPIQLSLRSPLLSAGDSVQMHNLMLYPLRVQASLYDPQFGRSEKYEFVISANGWHELGWLNGWQVAHGDILTIAAFGYRPSRWQF